MQDLSKIGKISELQIDGNRSIRYLKTGNGDPLILLHTIRTQLDYFEEVIPQLAKHFTVYAIDLPGHGYASIDTKAKYDEPYFRSAVIAFIEKLDLNKVTLVGESIGAVLALTVASQLPDRVMKVIASNTYDYDQRYGDGVRRGNFLANFVIGQFAIPYVGAMISIFNGEEEYSACYGCGSGGPALKITGSGELQDDGIFAVFVGADLKFESNFGFHMEGRFINQSSLSASLFMSF